VIDQAERKAGGKAQRELAAEKSLDLGDDDDFELDDE
jgi:hypothetical protein